MRKKSFSFKSYCNAQPNQFDIVMKRPLTFLIATFEPSIFKKCIVFKKGKVVFEGSLKEVVEMLYETIIKITRKNRKRI